MTKLSPSTCLAVGLALGLAGCQATAPLAATPSPAAVAASAGYQAPKITPQDYQRRTAQGERFVILDTRPAAAYAAEHIQDALDVTPDALPQSAPGLPKDRPLLLYCTCDDEGLSLKTAAALHDQYGFTNLQVILGGLAAWKEAGLPTAKGN